MLSRDKKPWWYGKKDRIQFGKYKGQLLSVLDSHPEYVARLIKRRDVREQHPELYEYLTRDRGGPR